VSALSDLRAVRGERIVADGKVAHAQHMARGAAIADAIARLNRSALRQRRLPGEGNR
jgi:hypothetical protein